MKDLSLSSILRVDENISFIENQKGHLVLMNLLSETEDFYLIKGNSKQLFLKIDGKKTLESIMNEVKDEFQLSNIEKLYEHSKRFFSDLLERKIVSEKI